MSPPNCPPPHLKYKIITPLAMSCPQPISADSPFFSVLHLMAFFFLVVFFFVPPCTALCLRQVSSLVQLNSFLFASKPPHPPTFCRSFLICGFMLPGCDVLLQQADVSPVRSDHFFLTLLGLSFSHVSMSRQESGPRLRLPGASEQRWSKSTRKESQVFTGAVNAAL